MSTSMVMYITHRDVFVTEMRRDRDLAGG